jgi:excisionase family DNA binding protein
MPDLERFTAFGHPLACCLVSPWQSEIIVSQRVLIPLPGIGTLALEEDAYRRALEEGAKFHPNPESTPDPNERLLDSQQLADILQVPVTWIEQQAREGNIPSLPFGRRRRYRRSAVEAAIKHRDTNINLP